MNKVCCGTISWTFQKRALNDDPDWCRKVLGEIAEAGYDGVEMGVPLVAFGAGKVRKLGY
ncbi:MAG: hypothetical protein R6V03_03305 [Kiritimatiellia bacterium]